jgi:anti-sigma factor RsiW
MSHDDLQSLCGAYALDALDPEEAAELEAHLAECPRCRSEVAEHRNTASLLATVGGEAPTGIWDRIAAELALDDSAPGAGLAKAPSGGLSGTPREDVSGHPKVVPLRSRRRVALPAIAALATAAAVAAVVLGVTAAHLNHRVNALSHAVGAGGLQQAAAAAVLNPQHRSVQLVSAGNHPTAQVVVLPDGNAYLVRSELPALDSRRTYQLWGLANGQAVSLGLLGSNPQLVAFRVDPGVSRLMVTAEPRGGVPQPTTPVLIQGGLPA